jgi:hypothetical protein
MVQVLSRPNTAGVGVLGEVEDVLGKRLRKEPNPLKTKVRRRGWDSDSGYLLKACKLLILGFAAVATTAEVAPVGYTSGTHCTQSTSHFSKKGRSSRKHCGYPRHSLVCHIHAMAMEAPDSSRILRDAIAYQRNPDRN